MKEQAIRSQLSPASIHVFGEIQLYDQIDSTNAAALRQLQSGKTGNWILLAQSQTAGRGRRGKQWLSPPGAGIYLSLVRQFDMAANALQALSLVTALSLQQALEAFQNRGFFIPNLSPSVGVPSGATRMNP